MKHSTRALGAVLAAALALGAGQAACRLRATRASAVPAAARVTYHCPMHPSYVSDRPGDCPICGMKLVRAEASAAAAAADPHAGHAPGGTPGRAVVSLSADRRRMLGVAAEPVRRAPLERTIRTSGRVAVDERRLHHVHTKYEAYVEHLHVDFTGKFVRKGEPLVSLYSPELVATQQEYLLAWRAQQPLARSGQPVLVRGALDLLEAARQRLLFWDVRPSDIERLQATGEVRRTLDLYSPVSGYVVQKVAYHGMRVTPADTLFDIADLSRLWVLADLYESDLAVVTLGTPAALTVAFLPGRTWRATVANVAPTVDERTRTVKVRLEVDNRAGDLKPEMFADVVLRAGGGTGLVVPEAAVVHGGERDLVFVQRADGSLEPRAVEIGGRTSAGLQVRRGVEEGERVVTSANFLLDSESSLRSALAAASPPPAHRH
jgi:membrane fusion protein, copper/silver efflux system